jgi:putative colanic acid biosynthesis acetyltransferase WcaF
MGVHVNQSQLKFVRNFSLTFFLLYGFNLAFIGLSTRPGYYLAFLHDHLNYIELWRSFNLQAASSILKILGHQVVISVTHLYVAPHGGFNLVYSCLGYGVMSSFTAFVISYPQTHSSGRLRFKGACLVGGLVIIQLLNILRLVSLAIFWNQRNSRYIDHHLLFNLIVYGTLIYFMYLCTRRQKQNQGTKYMNTTQLNKDFKKTGFDIGANKLIVNCWYLVSLVVFKSGLMPFSIVLVAILRLFGANIGKDVRIKPGIHVRYPWKLTVGDHSWLADCYIDNLDQVSLGKNVCISQQAMLQTGNHNYKETGFNLITKPIKIEDGVWIGAKSLVGPGVTAYSHAILTAGSTALHNLEAYRIYQGNPAKQKRQRIIAASV